MALNGVELFGRDATLIVDTIKIAMRDASQLLRPMLRMTFQITKSLAKDPNTAKIGIYNLSKDHRSLLQKRNVACSLEAGYIGNVHQIFSGNLEYGQSTLQGTDWITTLQAGDGSDKFKNSRVNVGIKGPVAVGKALRDVAQALGLPLGNTGDKTASLRTLTEFTKGLVLSGKTEVQLDKVAKAMGLQWSIQDGQLQFLGPIETVGGELIVLRPGSGLVGSPEAGERGYIKARTLMQPDLLPGRGVRIESREVNGTFRIEKTTFTGDTWGGDWYTDIEVKPI